MNRVSPKLLWLMIIESVLVATILVAFLRLGEAKAAYLDSSKNQRDCRSLKMEITKLRRLTSVAEETQPAASIANSQIIRLASDCGMTENQVSSIQRLSPVSVEDTDYERQDVAINIRAATMPQILQLALNAEAQRVSAKVTQMSLSHQRNTPGVNQMDIVQAERWNAELILTQLVFVATRAAK